MIQAFGKSVGHNLSQIMETTIPVDPRLMLVADMEHLIFHHKILLVNLLAAASLLIAPFWKLVKVPKLQDWIIKMKNIWLLSKLSAMCKYRTGHETAIRKCSGQWTVLVKSGYINDISHTGDSLLACLNACCT